MSLLGLVYEDDKENTTTTTTTSKKVKDNTVNDYITLGLIRIREYNGMLYNLISQIVYQY